MPPPPHTPRRNRPSHRHADLSPRDLALLLTGVFLMFAPVMVLSISDLSPRRPLPTLAFWSIVSGLVAAAWAGVSTVRPRLIPLLILLQIAVVALFAMQLPRPFAIGAPTVSIGGLGTIVLMASGYGLFVKVIRRQSASSARMTAELDLASQIHRTLVPDITRRIGPLDIHARSLASGQMGGDLMEVVEHEWGGGVIDVCLADVSGHGVRAGVVMAMVKSAIRTRLLTPTPLHDLVTDLNRVLAATIDPGMFATFAALRFHLPTLNDSPADAGTLRVEYCLAGHLPIFHIRPGTDASPPTVTDLPNDRLPLGMLPDETYLCGETLARKGDLFALYTDGLTEIAGKDARQLTHDNLRTIIAKSAHHPLPELHSNTLDSVRAHGPQSDDQTLILVRIL